ATRSSDDGDEIERRRRRDRVYPLSCTKQTRSSDNGEIEEESQIDDGDSNNGDTHGGHSHEDDEKRSSLSLVTTSLWKEHPVTTNNNHTTRFKISSKKLSSSPHDYPLHDSPLHDSPLHDSHLHYSLQKIEEDWLKIVMFLVRSKRKSIDSEH
ncbi:unnamed protein product, partial [Brassica oleracea]